MFLQGSFCQITMLMRTSFLSLFLLLVLHQIMAQAPAFVPGKVVGVPVHFPYDIVVDTDENIYIADAYSITKFDQEGNVDLAY